MVMLIVMRKNTQRVFEGKVELKNKNKPTFFNKDHGDDNNDDDNDVNDGAGDVDDAEHLGNLSRKDCRITKEPRYIFLHREKQGATSFQQKSTKL